MADEWEWVTPDRVARSLEATAQRWFDHANQQVNAGEHESCNRQGREAAEAARGRRGR